MDGLIHFFFPAFEELLKHHHLWKTDFQSDMFGGNLGQSVIQIFGCLSFENMATPDNYGASIHSFWAFDVVYYFSLKIKCL